MQIPTSAGVLANSVLPMTPTQGASLSRVGETAGSTSFAPVEAVSSVSVSRDIPGQRVQPDVQIGGHSKANEFVPYDKSGSSSTEKSADAAGSQDQTNNSQATQATQENNKNTDQAERTQGDDEQAERQQERQEQQDLNIIRELSQRDQEVRAHEQAHNSVGGQYAGAASYTYQRGPDGVNYAVGGEVSIDIGVVDGNPQATLEKMQTVQRAALAPAEPSSQDRRVAAMAAQQANQARAEIAAQSREAISSESSNETGGIEPQITTGLAKDISGIKTQESDAKDTAGRIHANGAQEDSLTPNEVLNDRIAKINEIILAISQSDAANATGKLLNEVV